MTGRIAITAWTALFAAVSVAALEEPDEPPKVYYKDDLPSNKWVKLEDGSDFMPANHDPKLIAYMQQYAQQQKKEKEEFQKQRRAYNGYNYNEAGAYDNANNYDNAQAYDNANYDNAAYDNAAYDNAEYDNAAYDNEAYDNANYDNANGNGNVYGNGGSSATNDHYRDHFLDGSETFWPEGAQAWRLLGYYIDCYQIEQGYKDRKLNSHSGDQGCDNGACLRYLLWAAYVDINYEGGGIGEYQYYNTQYQQWDDTACEIAGNERCAKMDCHLQNSENFYLLGFFKEPNFASFYEQLFKHQGVCIWGDDEYEFMQNMRENWPRCCTASGYEENGQILYFDKKPLSNAKVTLGLYTDERCSVDYTGSTPLMTVVNYYETYVKGQNQYNQGEDEHQHREEVDVASLVTYIDDWNTGMQIYHTCQPCKAYTIDYESNGDDQYWNNKYNGNWYYYQRNGNWNYDDDNNGHEDDYSQDDSQGNFLCEDDAGYKNVNQCMKFATHTKMMAATFRDVMTGANQGTIVDVYVGNIEVHPGAYYVPGTNWQAADVVKTSLAGLFFLTGAVMLALTYLRMSYAANMNNNNDYKTNLLENA